MTFVVQIKAHELGDEMVRRHVAILALIAAFSGCKEDVVGPASSPGKTTPVTPIIVPTPGAVSPIQTRVVALPGSSRTIFVNVVDTHGQPLSNRVVTWTSDNTSVVKVAANGNCGATTSPGCYRTSIYAIRAGVANVTAMVDGVYGSVTVQVPAIVDGPAGVAATFEVIEYENHAYAPLITVAETTGSERAEIVGVLLAIPGVPGPRQGRGSVQARY
jgi:hypothetical protein